MSRALRDRTPTFLYDVANQLIGAAWLTPELRVQLADAWRYVLGPEHSPNFDRWLSTRSLEA